MQTRWLKISALTSLPIILFSLLWVQKSWQPRTLRIGDSQFKFTFTEDSQRLRVARNRKYQDVMRDFQFWDIASQSVQKTVPDARQKVIFSALSPDEKRVVGMINERTLKVWNASTGKLERTMTKPEGLATYTLEFSPDSKIWAESRADNGEYVPPYPNSVLLWEASSGKLLRTMDTGGNAVTSFSFTPDGKTLIGRGMKATQIWDVASGLQLWKSVDYNLHSLRSPISNDGQTWASDAGMRHSQPIVNLWDVKTGKLKRKLTGKWIGASQIYSITFSPNGKTVAAVGNDPNGCPPQPPGSTGCTFTGHGVPMMGEIHLWDTRTGKPLRTLINNYKPFGSVAFSADGKLLAAGSVGETLIWEIATGKLLRTLRGNRKTAYQLCFSPDGNTLATGSFRNEVTGESESTIQLFRPR